MTTSGNEYDYYKELDEINKKMIDIEQQNLTISEKDLKAKELIAEAEKVISNATIKLKTYTTSTDLKLNNTVNVNWSKTEDGTYELERVDNKTFKNDSELKEWKSDISTTLNSELEIIKSNSKSYIKTNTNADNAALAFDALLNDDNFKEIEKLERYIQYRMFYFPGGLPKLKINGHGKDNEYEEYDNLDSKVDPFSENWDYRYIRDYVEVARSNSFHRWFIAVIPSSTKTTFKPMNFGQFYTDYVKQAPLMWINESFDEDKVPATLKFDELAGAMAGLEFMDKLDSFIAYLKEMQVDVVTKKRFNTLKGKLSTFIQMKNELNNNLIKQSEEEFKNNNIGWLARSYDYAFDCAQYTAELIRRRDEYEKFKEQLWAVLKTSPAINLCTNYTSVTGNNVSIVQEMKCVQVIQDSETTTDVSNSYDTIDGGANIPDLSVENNTPTTPTTIPTPTTTPNNDKKEESSVIWYVILGVIIIAVISGIAYAIYIYKKPLIVTYETANKEEENKDKIIEGGVVKIIL